VDIAPPPRNLLPVMAKLNDLKRVTKTKRRPNKNPSSAFILFMMAKDFIHILFMMAKNCAILVHGPEKN
jgi:hypothetical protein